MRILFIHNKYQQRGGEDVAVELESELLREKGHEVSVLYFENNRVSPLRVISNSHSYRKVREEIEFFKPDIVHIHNLFFEASPSVIKAVKDMRLPVVMTVHNYRLICANALLLRNHRPCELCVGGTLPLHGIRYKCYRHSAAASAMVVAITGMHKLKHTWDRKVDRYIFLTEFAKSRFIDSSLNVESEKMVMKPNFVKEIGVGGKREDFFLFVGRLSEEKGIDVLLKAANGFRVVVAGGGGDFERLNAEGADFRGQGVGDVKFLGQVPREQVFDYMKRCAALVFPSIWYEGLPYTILEAFSLGTPVIASNLGSMGEMIENGINGLHFEPGNADDLRDKLNLFLQLKEEERKKLSDNARATYLRKYHPDIHYRSILSIYDSVIAENVAINV